MAIMNRSRYCWKYENRKVTHALDALIHTLNLKYNIYEQRFLRVLVPKNQYAEIAISHN